jgi:hypothetical protein
MLPSNGNKYLAPNGYRSREEPHLRIQPGVRIILWNRWRVITFVLYLESWSSINRNIGVLSSVSITLSTISVSGAATSATYSARTVYMTLILISSLRPLAGPPRFQDFVNLGYQRVFLRSERDRRNSKVCLYL